MAKKKCTKCGLPKDAENDFGLTTSHGKPWRRATCKTCQAKTQSCYRTDNDQYSRSQLARNYGYKERNRLWLEEQKTNQPCVD